MMSSITKDQHGVVAGKASQYPTTISCLLISDNRVVIAQDLKSCSLGSVSSSLANVDSFFFACLCDVLLNFWMVLVVWDGTSYLVGSQIRCLNYDTTE
jgi:hypothetical protein